MCPRPAPIASRIANSRRRAMARPSRRFETFAQASRSIRPDAMPKPAREVRMSFRYEGQNLERLSG